MRYESAQQVLKAAKIAFKNIDRSYYEKSKILNNKKPFKKKIGFIDGTREIVTWM